MADPRSKGTTRRALLPALAGAAVAIPAAGMVITAMGDKPTHNPDAALFGAWQRFLAARDAFDVACEHDVMAHESPVAAAALADLDRAEAAFKSIPATTPAGFAIKLSWLWLDLSGMAYVEDFILNGKVPTPDDIPYREFGCFQGMERIAGGLFLEMIQQHQKAGAI